MPLFQITIEEAKALPVPEYRVRNLPKSTFERLLTEYSYMKLKDGANEYTLFAIDYDFYILYRHTELYTIEVSIIGSEGNWKVERAIIEFTA